MNIIKNKNIRRHRAAFSCDMSLSFQLEHFFYPHQLSFPPWKAFLSWWRQEHNQGSINN